MPRSKRLKPFHGINMIPFIDIMLVIVVVLILVSTAVREQKLQQFKMTFPKGTIGHTMQHRDRLLIYIDVHGKYQYRNAQGQLLPFTLSVLSPDKQDIAIAAHPKVAYQAVIHLLSILHNAQALHITLLSQQGQSA